MEIQPLCLIQRGRENFFSEKATSIYLNIYDSNIFALDSHFAADYRPLPVGPGLQSDGSRQADEYEVLTCYG
jgi:hypothetical protein